MNIFIDKDCKCHVSNLDGIYTQIEAPSEFNGKCAAYIEGFRVRPEGYTYTSENGKTFGPNGKEVSPWRDLALLNEFQAQYESQQVELLAACEVAYQEGVNSVYD